MYSNYLMNSLVLGSLPFRLCSFHIHIERGMATGFNYLKQKKEEEGVAWRTQHDFWFSNVLNKIYAVTIAFHMIEFGLKRMKIVQFDWRECVWVLLHVYPRSSHSCGLWISECIINSGINPVCTQTHLHTAKKSLTSLLLLMMMFVCSNCGKFWQIEQFIGI